MTIDLVSADKAYISVENFETVAQCGGEAFIAFKSNHTGAVGGMFEKMFHFFQFKKEEFLNHYHKRSNVESSMFCRWAGLPAASEWASRGSGPCARFSPARAKA